MRYKAHTHQDLKTLLNDLPTSYQGPALLIVKAVNLCSSAQTVTSLTHLNRHSVQKLVCSPAHGKSCVSFTVSAALTWLIDSALCVCIRWAVCVFVSFQTNNKRAFRFKFSPAKQMMVSLQEKKTSKWKKDTGEREEEKKSLTPQFDCCCHGNQADADYYGLHWDVDLKSSCRHDLSIHPSFVSSLKQIEKHDRPVPGPSIGFCLLTEADPRRHVRK